MPDPTGSPPRLSAALQRFVEGGTLAGAVVLVASRDRVLDLEAVGSSDIAAKAPMRADALFWIASMSKPITATALMMLVDEGKVSLDDPVEKHLPEFRGQMVAVEATEDRMVLQKPAHPITVREILSHTSGLPFLSRAERTIDGLSLREAAISYGMSPLRFEPGTRYEYSNAGINTAGRIVEVSSGMRFEEFLERRLFGPLGMKDTTFWPREEQAARLARSYRPGPGNAGLAGTKIDQLSYPLTDRKRGPSPAGGLFSTAADMSLFCRMILAGGTLDGRHYLSEEAVRQMTSTQTGTLLDPGGEGGYGFGWSTTRKAPAPGAPGGPVSPGPFGHGGAYATNMWIDPQRGLVMIFMVQHAGFPGPDGSKILSTFQEAAVEAFGR